MPSAQDYSPILIAAPTVRSGSTLLQRLFCSSSNSLIYGETVAHDIDLAINLYVSKKLYMGQGGDWRIEQMDKVLSGDVNDWIADLTPYPTEYLKALEASIWSNLSFLENFAAEKGRTIWGVKLPGWNPFQLRNTLDTLPNAKLVYLIRDLKSCVQSAKRKDMIKTLPEIENFALQWKNSIEAVTHKINHPKLILKYEDLIHSPDGSLRYLEDFTGIKHINKSILEEKINNFARFEGDAVYQSPSKLTEQEEELIANYNQNTSY
ncbi:MAG: sulfotransferase [Saprospiraceae bacterium]|nr:sulfotransferase [Saprospiraceae bacterium]